MPAAAEITENLLRENIERAVSDVFSTMLGRGTQFRACVPMPPKSNVPEVIGMVGFAGDIVGLVYLYFEQPFAIQCTSRMLGMSEDEVRANGDEVVNDTIGELTNMVTGSFKNALCDAGFPCKLTIPSILRGRHLCIEPVGKAQRNCYTFQSVDQPFTADVIIKITD